MPPLEKDSSIDLHNDLRQHAFGFCSRQIGLRAMLCLDKVLAVYSCGYKRFTFLARIDCKIVICALISSRATQSRRKRTQAFSCSSLASWPSTVFSLKIKWRARWLYIVWMRMATRIGFLYQLKIEKHMHL